MKYDIIFKAQNRAFGEFMDLLNCKIKPIYFKYLAAASGSAVIGAFLEWLMQWSSENTTVLLETLPLRYSAPFGALFFVLDFSQE